MSNTPRTDYRRSGQPPTQVRYPWRAAGRTFVQVYIPVIAVVVLGLPAIIEVVDETAGEHLPDRLRAWLLAASTAASVLALLAARLMALPAVTAILERVKGLGWLAPAPVPPHQPTDPDTGERTPIRYPGDDDERRLGGTVSHGR